MSGIPHLLLSAVHLIIQVHILSGTYRIGIPYHNTQDTFHEQRGRSFLPKERRRNVRCYLPFSAESLFDFAARKHSHEDGWFRRVRMEGVVLAFLDLL